MRSYLFYFFLLSVLLTVIECKHTFLGTNVERELVYHHEASFTKNSFRKRIEYFNFTMFNKPTGPARCIQGILAYDLTNSGATANVTEGGIGSNFVKIRMKSDRGEPLKYDLYIYS